MTNCDNNQDDIFPPFSPNLSEKTGIKAMDIISNLEVTKDLEFDHQYILEMIENLTPILCNKCNDLSKHFLDPSFYVNQLYLKNARWVPNKNSVISMDIEPYKDLTVPIFDIQNIKLNHPSNRPIGKIHLVREASEIRQKFSFVNAARTSSLSALKKLREKPYMSEEIAFKLSEDVDQGVLIKVDQFLELEEVKKEGITKANVD